MSENAMSLKETEIFMVEEIKDDVLNRYLKFVKDWSEWLDYAEVDLKGASLF
jgi:hypothetical protein